MTRKRHVCVIVFGKNCSLCSSLYTIFSVVNVMYLLFSAIRFLSVWALFVSSCRPYIWFFVSSLSYEFSLCLVRFLVPQCHLYFARPMILALFISSHHLSSIVTPSILFFVSSLPCMSFSVCVLFISSHHLSIDNPHFLLFFVRPVSVVRFISVCAVFMFFSSFVPTMSYLFLYYSCRILKLSRKK